MQQRILSSSIHALVSGAARTGTALTMSALPFVAHAQAPGGTSRPAAPPAPAMAVLPPVTVTGTQPGNTNDATTGIARLPETVRETPKTVLVIPKEILAQQQVTSLEQALRNVPGITISAGEGNGGQNGDQFRIRGLSAKGDIYVDGMRDFGAYRRDIFNTESVEVIKGPAGESFGVGGVGGLINQTTKKAGKGTRTSIDQSVGAGATYRTTVDSNIALTETSAVRLNGMFQEGKVPGRDHVEDDRRGIAIDFGTGLGTSTTWHLNYAYLHRSGPPDYGQPMAQGADGLYQPIGEYGVPGLGPSTSYVRNTDRDTSNAHIVTSAFQTALGGLTVNNDTRFSYYQRDFSGTNPAGVPYGTLKTLLAGGNAPLRYGARGGMTYLQRGWGVQNVTTVRGEFHTGSLRHRAMAGLDLSYQRDHRDRGLWTGRLNNQTVVNPAFDASKNASVSYVDGTRDANAIDAGVFVSDRVWFSEQFSLLGALRWDYFRSEFATSASSMGGSADSRKLSPAISAMWEPTKNAMLYASFSRTYRPVGTDIGLAVGGVQTEVPQDGVSSEPERADTVEIGAKLDLLERRLGVTGALFQIRKANAYTIDPATGEVTNGFGESGEGRLIRGVELGANGWLTPAWSVSLAYAYLDGEVSNATLQALVGNVAPGVPHHNLSLWTTYTVPHTLVPLPGKLTMGGGIRYASGYWADSANTAQVPDTLSLDAMVSYEQGKYRISLNGYNLTDSRNYSSSFNASRAVPASGRTVLVNVGMTF
ncbi:TonB-dependent receptor [Cupriavidus agavae]|uniref:Catecholate siderophore receptor n=1 Tax=Cupriavidus agavae TaxID=1001822 RepID=A0A4Q7RC67_9BURK|nr:TonB-dependent siderophore receptor [Cupriavidus agavae]RZT30765.1 catecholate siderophore receptor [Cupriavidus agavae]